jgi:hypothetical protein
MPQQYILIAAKLRIQRGPGRSHFEPFRPFTVDSKGVKHVVDDPYGDDPTVVEFDEWCQIDPDSHPGLMPFTGTAKEVQRPGADEPATAAPAAVAEPVVTPDVTDDAGEADAPADGDDDATGDE